MHSTAAALKNLFIEDLRNDKYESVAMIFEGKMLIRTDQSITITTKSASPKAIESAKLIGRLRDYMNTHDLTETEVARELKISKGTLTHWFNGRNLPKPAVFKRIKEYLESKGAK